MIKRIIGFLMAAVFAFGFIPSIVKADMLETKTISINRKTSSGEPIGECTLEILFSENGIAMARFDELCTMLDLEFREISGNYLCRKHGLVTGHELESPSQEELLDVILRYQLFFKPDSIYVIQINSVLGNVGRELPETPKLIDGSLWVPLASFVLVNNGNICVMDDKIQLTVPTEMTLTDIVGWKINNSLWDAYYFDPIGCINEHADSLIGDALPGFAYCWEGIYDFFHNVYDTLFGLGLFELIDDLVGGAEIECGEAMALAMCSKPKLPNEYDEQIAKLERNTGTSGQKPDTSEGLGMEYDPTSESILKEMVLFIPDVYDYYAEKLSEGYDLTFTEDHIDITFKNMLAKSEAESVGFGKISDLNKQMGTDETYIAYAQMAAKMVGYTYNSVVKITSACLAVCNDVERSVCFDANALNELLRISTEYGTEIERKNLNTGVTSKAESIKENLESSKTERILNTIGEEIGYACLSTAGDMIGREGLTYLMYTLPKIDKLSAKSSLTLAAIGLGWSIVDSFIDEYLGDLSDEKLAINLAIMYYTAKMTYIRGLELRSGSQKDRVNEIYTYIKANYASRQLLIDFGRFNAYQNDLELLKKQRDAAYALAVLSTAQEGTNEKVFDEIAKTEEQFASELSALIEAAPDNKTGDYSVVADNGSVFVIKTDGSLWAWGLNDHGQLGIGSTKNRSEPTFVMNDVKEICCFGKTVFAIKKDSTLWAWGDNRFGTVGDGTKNDCLSPKQITDKAKTLFNGICACYLVKTDDSLWSWGENNWGALGDGTERDRYYPQQVMEGISTVHPCDTEVYAVTNDNRLIGWGHELGIEPKELFDGCREMLTISGYGYGYFISNNNSMFAIVKGSITHIMDNTAAFSISCGYDNIERYAQSVLVRQNDGSIWKWTIYDGDIKEQLKNCTPACLFKSSDSVARALALNGYCYYIKSDGSLYILSNGDEWQPLSACTENSDRILIEKDVADVYSVGRGSLAYLKKDGSLYTWGSNNTGELGNNSTSWSMNPQKILDEVKEVYPSSYTVELEDELYESYNTVHAVKTDGTLWAWGSNVCGQIGDGTTQTRYSPVEIMNLFSDEEPTGGQSGSEDAAASWDGFIADKGWRALGVSDTDWKYKGWKTQDLNGDGEDELLVAGSKYNCFTDEPYSAIDVDLCVFGYDAAQDKPILLYKGSNHWGEFYHSEKYKAIAEYDSTTAFGGSYDYNYYPLNPGSAADTPSMVLSHTGFIGEGYPDNDTNRIIENGQSRTISYEEFRAYEEELVYIALTSFNRI